MKISIIIPVYNVKKYLRECLDSILAQSYKDFEIILVDDGSTDSSGNICDEYSMKYENIKVLHKNNNGLSSARNAGLDIAQGEYILFIDSDDVVSPIMLETLIAHVAGYDIVSFGIMIFEDGRDKKFKPYMKQPCQREYTAVDFLKRMLRHEIDNGVGSKLYRKDILGNVHFQEGKVNEDFLFNVNVLKQKTLKIYCITDPLYYYRIRVGSITQDVHPERFQFVTNALDMRRKNDSITLDISEYFDAHLFYEIINFPIFLWRKRNVSHFKKEYEFCLKYLKNNLCLILRSKHLSIKEKMKLLVLLIYPSFYLNL